MNTLSTVIGETLKHSGEGYTTSSISIAPQEPWIYEGTIKENILLGNEYDEERYNKVTFAASLLPDFEILPNGDQTVIGDKGVTLSGGQRARVGLARGLYVKADLYLLDDPLAAVDPEVAMVIYERAVQGFLADKERVNYFSALTKTLVVTVS